MQPSFPSSSSFQSMPDPPASKSSATKSRPKKKTQSDASGLLGFKVEHKDHIPFRIPRTQPQAISDITLSPYYRFAVSPGNYRDYHSDPNLPIDWDSVRKVRVLTDSEVRCPICLEKQLLAGRANKCGHYYCWPCIIRYSWTCQGTKKCPVCNDSLKSIDLRPVSIQVYHHITENSIGDFSLIKRPKGFITLFSCAFPQDPTVDGTILSSSTNVWNNKLAIYTESLEDLNNENQALQAAMLNSDEFEQSSIQRALDFLPKVYSESVKPETSAESNYAFFYFYQLADTQPYFLHPLNMTMLKHEFGDYERFPLTIKSRILQIDPVHITETEQRKYG
jgi:hypothetical protein